MLLADVVATSAAVGATRSRTAKTAALAALLRAAAPDEVEPATAWLAGELRQGRIGTGWRTLSGLDAPPAAAPTLAVTRGRRHSGRAGHHVGLRLHGRGGPRCSASCSAPPPPSEQAFLRRLLTGELRQGALEGVMLEADRRGGRGAGRGRSAARSCSPAGCRHRRHGARPAAPPRSTACRLQVGVPVRPMLASPADTLDAALAELGGEVSVEFKLDGARIQVHRDGDEVRVWTRTLREITGERAGAGRAGARAAVPRRWCSTARRSRCATTAAPARSRRR